MDRVNLDPLLVPFVQAATEEQAELILVQILCDHVDRLISSILKFKMRACFADSACHGQDRQDIHQEAQLRVLGQLRRLRMGTHHIASLRDYIAVVTYNTFHEYLRRVHPARSCLKNRVQYVLTHTAGLALWKRGPHSQHGGLEAWDEERRECAGVNTRRQDLVDSPARFLQEALTGRDPNHVGLRDLISAIFTWVNESIELDQLVTIVAGLTGVRDDTARQQLNSGAANEPRDARPSVGAELDQRVFLERVWTEMIALPLRQRQALLLSLDEVHSLPIVGIARVRHIADAVGMSAAQLAEIWNELPWDDAAIAQHLGVTRQQIINLRKAARERLTRRMNHRGSYAA